MNDKKLKMKRFLALTFEILSIASLIAFVFMVCINFYSSGLLFITLMLIFDTNKRLIKTQIRVDNIENKSSSEKGMK